MNILEPNTGEEAHYIVKDNVYVSVTDYGQLSLLKEIKIGPGQRTWYWIVLKETVMIDVSDVIDAGQYCSFDHAINRAVNDPYCTVYAFGSYQEMAKDWKKIKHVETITTIYKEEG